MPTPEPIPTGTPPLAPTVTPTPLVGAVVTPAAEAVVGETPIVEPETEEGIVPLPEEMVVSEGVGWPLRQIEIALGVVLAMLVGVMVFSRRQRGRRQV